MKKDIDIYALQVITKREEKYINLFYSLHPDIGAKLYFPKRELNERRNGKIFRKFLPVFPGYVFLEFDEPVSEYLRAFRAGGFVRFLKSNHDICGLKNRDLDLVLHFIKKPDAVSEISKVYFSENDRIVVVKGALQGLEGNIIKVDKRKGHAKVKLDFCSESFTIDLAFETIERGQKCKIA